MFLGVWRGVNPRKTILTILPVPILKKPFVFRIVSEDTVSLPYEDKNIAEFFFQLAKNTWRIHFWKQQIVYCHQNYTHATRWVREPVFACDVCVRVKSFS